MGNMKNALAFFSIGKMGFRATRNFNVALEVRFRSGDFGLKFSWK